MKILVGYDGSECANAAIEDLARAGIGADCEVVVLSGVDVWPHLSASMFEELEGEARKKSAMAVQRAHRLAAMAMEEARGLAKEGAERVGKVFADAKVQAEARAESPATALVAMVEEWGADLVVVGSHGRSSLGRAMFGSVSQAVVSNARCSVRVARRRPGAAGRGLRILIGVDGSSNSAAAVQAVAMRSWPAETDVVVVVALDVQLAVAIPVMEEGEKADEAGIPAWVSAMAEGSVEELRRAGLAAEPLLRLGDPKKVLVEEAKALDADCIFVGARGRSRLERLLLGSVATAVCARAECSVEVIRTGAD
ncbi:MAG TPA: universal stress protein [Tepidisphaeraceae bacterium]|jgi:nucleotide-binding universal stress UspA family protein|nr:universal stress protein [Tepidisphaeraceae bacterium]